MVFYSSWRCFLLEFIIFINRHRFYAKAFVLLRLIYSHFLFKVTVYHQRLFTIADVHLTMCFIIPWNSMLYFYFFYRLYGWCVRSNVKGTLNIGQELVVLDNIIVSVIYYKCNWCQACASAPTTSGVAKLNY